MGEPVFHTWPSLGFFVNNWEHINTVLRRLWMCITWSVEIGLLMGLFPNASFTFFRSNMYHAQFCKHLLSLWHTVGHWFLIGPYMSVFHVKLYIRFSVLLRDALTLPHELQPPLNLDKLYVGLRPGQVKRVKELNSLIIIWYKNNCVLHNAFFFRIAYSSPFIHSSYGFLGWGSLRLIS